MFTRKPPDRPEIVWFGCALTWSAGFVDAIGYLTLRDIYVANMSGNTVAVAIHLSRRDWAEAWAHACPLLAFVPGLIAGDAIVELCRRSRLGAALAPAILIEAAGLALFILLADRWISSRGTVQWHGGTIYATLVGLLAFSMGMQNGLLRRTGSLKDVHTYVTGTLLAAAHGCTRYLFWLRRRLRHITRKRLHSVLRYSPHHRSLREGSLAAALWTLYITGATVGAVARLRYSVNVLLIPFAILIVIAVTDAVRPIRRSGSARSA
jgi:uncharacterized membrane protein YoaK (UPF0700 family)